MSSKTDYIIRAETLEVAGPNPRKCADYNIIYQDIRCSLIIWQKRFFTMVMTMCQIQCIKQYQVYLHLWCFIVDQKDSITQSCICIHIGNIDQNETFQFFFPAAAQIFSTGTLPIQLFIFMDSAFM